MVNLSNIFILRQILCYLVFCICSGAWQTPENQHFIPRPREHQTNTDQEVNDEPKAR